MTLEELTDFVCKKVGQFDAVSLGICGDFINRRYEMIYDAENWLDTLEGRTIQTVVDDPYVDVPTVIGRVMVVQIVGGKVLEHVDIQFILETQPELLVGTPTSGTPIYYREFTNQSKVDQFQLMPPPNAIFNLFIYGQLAFVPMADADSPLIRNIDNCLIAYATGDMLTRARQYTKAKESYTEAAGLLEELRKIETQLGNLPRRSKNLTVAGDSLTEMTDEVCSGIGDYSAPTQIRVKDMIRRNYNEIWDSHLWLESTVMFRVERRDSEVILPVYADRVLSIRADSNLGELSVEFQTAYFGVSPQIFEQEGTPVSFNILTPSAVTRLPLIPEQLAFVSTDLRDLSPVFVRGETGGVEASEAIVLNGTNTVYTNNLYDMPMTVAKQVTYGDVVVTGRTLGTLLVRILASERERKHIRLWLLPTPLATDQTECLVLAKRKINPLVTDEDTPLLRGIGNLLIWMTIADWFSAAGNDKAGAFYAQKAKESKDTMMSREASQTAYRPRIIPYTDGVPYGDDGITTGICGWI